METVVALLMFVNFEIKEHRIQESMGMCLRGKREAERQYSETVTYKCLKTQAEVDPGYRKSKGPEIKIENTIVVDNEIMQREMRYIANKELFNFLQ